MTRARFNGGVSVLLALGSAAIYGLADFSGGMASKRVAASAVVWSGQALSLVVLVPALLLVPGRVDGASLAWGAGAGLFGGAGVLVFYRTLAIGTMSVVAPLTAVVSAVVPVAAGLLLGERPPAVALVGVVLALVAVVLVSAEGGRLPSPAALRGPAIGGAVLAGALFGLLFVLLSRAGHGSGMWPLLGARLASIGGLGAVGLAVRLPLVARGAPPGLLAASGFGDMAANVLFVLASRLGLLSITGVLVALYPAGTVLLALLVLRERLARVQVGGLLLAGAGVALIALG